MNHAKIAAALHALADAFLEGVETVEAAVKPAKGSKKAAVLAGPTEPTVTPEAVAPVAAPTPVVPTITKEQLNKAVLAVAAKSRDVAEKILKEFGASNTVTLPAEKWQAVYDRFEEELAKIDAAAVQIAQASLV